MLGLGMPADRTPSKTIRNPYDKPMHVELCRIFGEGGTYRTIEPGRSIRVGIDVSVIRATVPAGAKRSLAKRKKKPLESLILTPERARQDPRWRGFF